MQNRYQFGDNITIDSKFTDALGSGINNASGVVYIHRISNNEYFDGSGWQAAKISENMIENIDGWWSYEFNTSNLSGDDEVIFEVEDASENAYIAKHQAVKGLVGGYVNYIDGSILAVSGSLSNGQTNIRNDIASTSGVLSSGHNDIIGYVDELEAGQTTISGFTDTLEAGHATIISDITAASGVLDAKLDTSLANLTQILADIVAMSGAIPADVWTFANRTLTSISGLEVNIDASGVQEVASGVWNYSTRTLTDIITTGDGSVVVNHNYGGADALRVLTDAALPVDNAIISAYLTSNFNAGNTSTVYIVAQTSTNVNGRWASPMNLDPETYTLVTSKQGEIQSQQTEITVT